MPNAWIEPPAREPLIFRCAAPSCRREFLTPEGRQHHVYHSHGAGNPKDDHAGEIDMAIYLGMPTGRGARYWSRKIRKAFRNLR